MSNYSDCPNCGRMAKKTVSSDYFPVYTCRKCGKKYYNECGNGRGTTCPKCGSTDFSEYDKVYSG